MSFVKALAGVAMGFAAAKGMEKYNQMGGMPGLQDALKSAGGGDMADQIGRMAEQFGLPGGSDKVKDMFGQMGSTTASMTEAGMAGLGTLMASMRNATEAGMTQSASMMEALFGQTPAADAIEQQAKLMIRAMIQAAKADGEIDPQEQATIVEKLGDLDEEEIAFVKAELAAPPDLQRLVQDAGDVGREQIYSTSLASIRVDNQAEATYLQQLARGLGLSDEQRDAIHARMGVAPLGG